MKTTQDAHTAVAGASVETMPRGLKKLGRLAVWLVNGGQFVDLVWGEDEVHIAHDGSPDAATACRPVSQTEFADLVNQARRSSGVSSLTR
jgi:hypothetical protein